MQKYIGKSLIISNEEMNDIMKTVQPLEESGLLIKSIGETIKRETKEKKVGFVSMLLATYIKMNLNLMVFIQEIIYLK